VAMERRAHAGGAAASMAIAAPAPMNIRREIPSTLVVAALGVRAAL
jgi:hypothetical protein